MHKSVEGNYSMSERITVGLVEDNLRTHQRFLDVLAQHSDWQILFAVTTLADARDALLRACPMVLLLDLGLPDGDGFDLITSTLSLQADCQILVISVFGDEKNILRCIKAGASGYLLKGQGDDELGEHIRDLLNGGSPMSPQIARYVLQSLRQHTPQSSDKLTQDCSRAGKSAEQVMRAHQELTSKELQILRDLALGHSYNEVAQRLQISLNTVRHHVKAIYSKLYVSSRTQAVNTAHQLGLLD